MRRILVMALAAGLASTAQAADVGISLSFSQPGVFGRIDIGQYPQPQVIVAQPLMIEPPPPAMPPPEPVYLWVPLDHRKHWERYCHQYNACGHPVYFVNHVWYRDHVMAHQARPAERHEHGRVEEEHGQGHGHEEDHHDRGHDEDHRDRGR